MHTVWLAVHIIGYIDFVNHCKAPILTLWFAIKKKNAAFTTKGTIALNMVSVCSAD